MASDIEEIFDAFTEAMEAQNQAVEVMTDGFNQLRAAARKLEGVYERLADWVGRNNDTGQFEHSNEFQFGLGLLEQGTKKIDFGNILDIGKLF
jgi:hypothetical protein